MGFRAAQFEPGRAYGNPGRGERNDTLAHGWASGRHRAPFVSPPGDAIIAGTLSSVSRPPLFKAWSFRQDLSGASGGFARHSQFPSSPQFPPILTLTLPFNRLPLASPNSSIDAHDSRSSSYARRRLLPRPPPGHIHTLSVDMEVETHLSREDEFRLIILHDT